MKAANHEVRLLALVGPELRIDADGSVWRIAVRKNASTPPRPLGVARRSEHRMKDGYLRVQGNVGGRNVKALAHRLVWVWKHGPISSGMEVNHINGDKADNRPANLELVTPKQNTRHARAVLGRQVARGASHGSAKLDDEGVAAMREQLAAGAKPSHVAQAFGVSHASVNNVRMGRTWKHVGGPAFPKPQPLADARKAKREEHAKEIAELRVQVLNRAKGRCEACGQPPENHDPLEVDHWLSGTGQRRARQALTTLWAIHRRCHQRRHTNDPSAGYWNSLWRNHCDHAAASLPPGDLRNRYVAARKLGHIEKGAHRVGSR